MDRPETIEQLQEVVRAGIRLHPFAGKSKTALASLPEGATPLDLTGLSGILEYDPNEYTFTAYAGTPITEITAALAAHGQYLPFDPMFAADGATIGGTVAANSSGSGRFRYGGVRDFILGSRFVDGYGRLVRGGGKVVKNAAGFDLPKFLVGSLGKYGVLADVTFKIFPKPAAYNTVIFTYENLPEALQATFALAVTPLEIDALDIRPVGDHAELLIRLGGLENGLPSRVTRLQAFLQKKTAVMRHDTADHLSGMADQTFWDEINRGLPLAAEESLVKVVVAPKQLLALAARVVGCQAHYVAGGNLAWVVTDNVAQLDRTLQDLGMSGLVVRGEPMGIIGRRQGTALAQRVKQALDPNGRLGLI